MLNDIMNLSPTNIPCCRNESTQSVGADLHKKQGSFEGHHNVVSIAPNISAGIVSQCCVLVCTEGTALSQSPNASKVLNCLMANGFLKTVVVISALSTSGTAFVLFRSRPSIVTAKNCVAITIYIEGIAFVVSVYGVC